MTSSSANAIRLFVALIPPIAIQNYAAGVIQDLGDRYQMRAAKAPPHITLQPPFLLQPEATVELEQQLRVFAQEHNPAPITLSGFGCFAPRVLYINVLKTPELITLQAHLMAHLEATLGIVDAVGQRRGFSPHLTVASRNVTRTTFRQAWADLQNQSVEFQFLGDRLTLLVHDGHSWQVRSEFDLGSWIK